ACPVIEAGLDLGPWADRPDEAARAAQRVTAWLASLAPDRAGGRLQESGVRSQESAKREGPAGLAPDSCLLTPDLAYLVGRVALRLQTLAGNTAAFAATRPLARRGRYRVAFEYEEEAVGRACLQAALALCRAAWEG